MGGSATDGLATIQFQSVSVNPTNAADLMGGTQDNGTWSNTPDWFETINGDGGQSGFDVGDPAIRFHTYYEASPDVNFRGNDPYGWNWIGDPLFETEPQSFYIPIIADPVNPGYLYAGLSHVWRTTDDGGDQAFLEQHCNEYTGDFKRHCGDWKSIGGHTGDLTSSVWGDRAGQYVVAVERAPSDSGTLWAATRIGRVFVSANADAHRVGAVDFARIDTTTTPGRFVSGISIDPADANHAWISYSGYEAYTPGQAGHVFSVRFDPASGTATWRDLSAGLGDQPVLDVAWDSVGRRLYAATDFGVLMRSRGTWVPAGAGLPTAAVYGLTIVPDSGVLYAATHGRGIWRLGL